jgi:hypothetical protein
MARKSAPMTDAAVWKDARGHIHIAGTVNGHKVISTVTSDPRSKRVHANLYRKLNIALRQQAPVRASGGRVGQDDQGPTGWRQIGIDALTGGRAPRDHLR